MQVVNAMTANLVTINADSTVAKAKMLMEAGRFRRLPVVDNDQLIGIISERDLREHLGRLELTYARAIMKNPVITVGPDDSVEEAARIMLKRKIGGLPVLQQGRLVGIVTYSDLLSALLRVLEATRRIMEP
jgi:acetoin utilization protein AcuB